MQWWLSSGDMPEGPFPAEHVTEWLKSGQMAIAPSGYAVGADLLLIGNASEESTAFHLLRSYSSTECNWQLCLADRQ